MAEAIPERYLVLRVPSAGPRAVVAPPFDFATRAEAEARVAGIEDGHLVVHHTHLEIQAYRGDRAAALEALGILY